MHNYHYFSCICFCSNSLNLLLGMLTKVNYLNRRSEDGGGLGCTLEPRIKEPLHLKQSIFKRIKRKPKQFTLVQSPPDLTCPWILIVQQKEKCLVTKRCFWLYWREKKIIEFIYCRRLKLQYFGALKNRAQRCPPAVAGIAGGGGVLRHC